MKLRLKEGTGELITHTLCNMRREVGGARCKLQTLFHHGMGKHMCDVHGFIDSVHTWTTIQASAVDDGMYLISASLLSYFHPNYVCSLVRPSLHPTSLFD